jgi:hypothetical protein
MGGIDKFRFLFGCGSWNPFWFGRKFLTSESVESLSLALEGVDNIHGGHSLTTSVLGVGDTVTDHVLKKDLEHTTSLFVDETRDTLDTTTTCETTDSGLGNTLDVIAKDLAMTLGATLSESLSSFSSARHGVVVVETVIP